MLWICQINTCYMEHRVPDGEPRFRNTPQERLKERSLLLTGPGGSTWHTSRGHMGRSRQSTEKDRTWDTCFYRGGFWVSLMEVLSKGHTRRDCWSQGRLGKSYQELTFACDSAGCFLGLVLARGAIVNWRSLRIAWPNTMDVKTAPPWISLARL